MGPDWNALRLTYGITPPKLTTPEPRRRVIAAAQAARIAGLPIDALVVYDLQDESSRTDAERPFPFLRAIDPLDYAYQYLGSVAQPRIIYRSVSGSSEAELVDWLTRLHGLGGAAVLVGASSNTQAVSLHLGDAYHCQCLKTARLLREKLGLAEAQVALSFQSRLGRAKWLEPYTEPTLIALGQQGVQRVDMVCPGFTSDCLETLEEIVQEGQHAYLAAGGKQFTYVPCLNDNPDWIAAIGQLAQRHLSGWDTGASNADNLKATCTRALAAGAKQ